MAIFSALLNFLWGLIATPVSIRLSRTFRLLDVPGGRKQHLETTPRGAGIVLWTGYLIWSLIDPNPGIEVPYIASGATIVFIVGYMDDMHPLSPAIRFFIHLLAAGWVLFLLPVPLFQRILVMFWIVGTTNAFNLVDGMDGLALSLAFITALMAYLEGNPYTWLPFCGLVAGVTVWNFPKARTFLGDGGSTLLGYICASHLAWDMFPQFFDMNPLVLCCVLLLIGGVPVVDTLFAMTRRIAGGRSPFSPDRGHAHHLLLDRHLAKWQVLALLAWIHIILLWGGFTLAGLRIVV